MSTIAVSADGVEHEFPDETPDTVINKVMMDYAKNYALANSTENADTHRAAMAAAETPEGHFGSAVTEPAARFLTQGALFLPSVAAGVVGGVVGAASGQGVETAKRWSQNVSDLAYQPRSLQGQAGQAVVDRVMAPVQYAMSVPRRVVAAAGGSPRAQDVADILTNTAAGAAAIRPAFNAVVDPIMEARALREAQANLADNPNAPLPDQVNALGEKIVQNAGGTTDKALYDQAVKQKMSSDIESLKSQAGPKYTDVKKAIGPSTHVDLPATNGYLAQRIADLGNEDLLSPGEKKIAKLVSGNPTYEALDTIRKEVGQRGWKNPTDFDTTASAQRDAIYKALSNDQAAVAKSHGVGDLLRNAQDLTIQYKGLQDDMQALYGKGLGKSVTQKISTAARGLQKGDVSQFNKVLGAAPDRRIAAAQVVNELMRPGNEGQIGVKFADALNSLSPTARAALEQEFPAGFGVQLDALAKAASMPMPEGGLLQQTVANLKKSGWWAPALEIVGAGLGIPGVTSATLTGRALVQSLKARNAAQTAVTAARAAIQ